MRTTTIDLPDEVLDAALALATRRHQSLSETIATLIRQEIAPEEDQFAHAIQLLDGLPTLSIGRSISAAEVRVLMDEDP